MIDIILQATGPVGSVLEQVGLRVGGATVAGGLAGWATKKALKIVAVLVGLQLAVMTFLQQRGFLTVQWDQLGSAIAAMSPPAAAVPAWVTTLSSFGIGGGFLAGALVGFKRG